MNWDALFQVVNIGPILGSVILGLFIGAFYGYELNTRTPARFPVQLYIVGIAFTVLIGTWAALDRASPFTLEYQYGRGILWTIVCIAIPVGRWMRMNVELWQVRRKRR